jgi:hypothetical protein
MNVPLLEKAAAGRKGMAVDLSEYETYTDIMPDRVEGVAAWIAVTSAALISSAPWRQP